MYNEIIVYSCGDSRDASTWSNVPFLFTRTLETKGIKVNRIDISPAKTLNKWFNRLSFLIFVRILHLKACPIFARTWLHRFIISRRLKKAVEAYPNADLNLFLSFAFTNPYSDKPNVLWCDWTDRVVIERLGRCPMWYENASLAYEDKVMSEANLVYTMFPVCKEHLEELYGREVRYLGLNVVNSFYKGKFNQEENVRLRYQSDYVVFIGDQRYLGAAKELIEAVRQLRQRQIDLKVRIIGMTADIVDEKDERVECYGYLHKDLESENEMYYRLLLGAKMFVNTAPQWGGYSSTIEAMYYGCPVIVAPYQDFSREFGGSIAFGLYKKEDDSLEQLIQQLVAMPFEDYQLMSNQAHHVVSDYTWSHYMDVFLKDISERFQPDN